MTKWIFMFVLLAVGTQLNAQKNAYSYKFKVAGLQDTTIYLANYYGGKLYFNDTTNINSKGEFSFSGKEPKPAGIYAIIFPDKQTYFEIIINEPTIVMETTAKDPINDMVVKTSKENTAFYEYMKFVSNSTKKYNETKANADLAEGAEKEKLQAELTKIQTETEAFRLKFIEDNKNLFSTKVLEASRDPEVPEPPVLEDGKPDSTFQYRYFKSHYFDYVDLKDERMIRTPILHKKIDYYLQKLSPQTPDSICAAADYMISLSGDTGLIFRYIVQYTTSTYEKSNIMGMDAVFICMAEKYYAQGKCTWVDSTQLADILDKYETRKNLVLGKVADNITLLDTNEKWHALHSLKADFTVLIFWDPNCGHCKKEMPKLKEFYKEWKNKGVEIFAVSTEFENKDWKKYIANNELGFINVSDNPEVNKNAYKYISEGKTTLNSLNFRDYWDLFSTPQLYVLDKDKKIIAKKLGAEQLGEFIESYKKAQSKN